MCFAKVKSAVNKYFPVPALVLFALGLVAAVIHIACIVSESFSDFFNRYVAAFVRGVLATVTGVLPFSLAETLIIMIPVLFVTVIAVCVRLTGKDTVLGARFVASFASVLSVLYTLFVLTTAAGYNGTSLAHKLGLIRSPVTAEELRYTAVYMSEKANETLDEVNYAYGGHSVMPYSFEEMNGKLLEAYARAAEKYPFMPRLQSRLKPIALSEPMTYTHISGIFTYYTGESNININFPDYTLPFTAAHELAHQRGFMPEDEANFVAFLVCDMSDDPYIRYSGYVNMYEYLSSALYTADYGSFSEVYLGLDYRVRGEMLAYNEFFEKYRDNTAADVSSAMNDAYLKAQGQTAGEKSYGMVVDLAVAYVKAVTR